MDGDVPTTEATGPGATGEAALRVACAGAAMAAFAAPFAVFDSENLALVAQGK